MVQLRKQFPKTFGEDNWTLASLSTELDPRSFLLVFSFVLFAFLLGPILPVSYSSSIQPVTGGNETATEGGREQHVKSNFQETIWKNGNLNNSGTDNFERKVMMGEWGGGGDLLILKYFLFYGFSLLPTFGNQNSEHFHRCSPPPPHPRRRPNAFATPTEKRSHSYVRFGSIKKISSLFA